MASIIGIFTFLLTLILEFFIGFFSFVLNCAKLLIKILISLLKYLLYFGIYLTRLLLRPLFGCFPPKSINQMSGQEFEKLVARWLESKGYRKVKLTPDSGDYGVDITAEKDGERVGIQCKRYEGKVGVGAVQEIVAGLNYYNCQKGFVVTNSIFTKNAQDLAETNGIELIDGKALFKSKTIKRYLNSKTRLYFYTCVSFLYCFLSIALNVYAFVNLRAFLPLTVMLLLVTFLCGLNGILEIRRKKNEENSKNFS